MEIWYWRQQQQFVAKNIISRRCLHGVIVVTYLSLAIPFLQTMKLDCGKGLFSLKGRKVMQLVGPTYVYVVYVVVLGHCLKNVGFRTVKFRRTVTQKAFCLLMVCSDV